MSADDDIITTLLSELSVSDGKLEELSPLDHAAYVASLPKAVTKVEDISPEDAAWADSLLVASSELSQNAWNAPTKALINTTAFEAPSSDDIDEMQQEVDGSSQESEDTEIRQAIRCQEEGDRDSDTEAEEEEGMGVDENIFRVWDLGTPDEEGELATQLKKALASKEEQKVLDGIVDGLANLMLKPFSD